MKIELNCPYKSITTLKTDDLPDFAVLIGRNGAGKTQLLDALKQGVAKIQNIGVNEIELHDMTSFIPPNSLRAGRGSLQLALDAANAYLSPLEGQPPIETAKTIFCEFASNIEHNSGIQARENFVRDLKSGIQHLSDFTIFGEKHQGSTYEETIYEQVLKPLVPKNTDRKQRRSSDHLNRFNGNQATLLSTAMKQTEKLPHELTRQDILRASHVEGDMISNSISEVFTGYKLDQYHWTHTKIETMCINFTELITQYRANNPPPWETLRKIMSEMRDAAGDDGLFDFDFSDPENHEINMSNYEQFSFAAVMTNRTSNTHYKLDSMSSGEKILMTLCLVSFNQHLGRPRPKLLLLDELDAFLHPSMLAALVRTLRTLFVARGTKVLLTSHSPMTVAALDESAIFRVVRTGNHIDVSRTTKPEAIIELSEGIATVDMGLKIAAFDEAKVTILTEGNNTKHLRRWASINFPNVVRVFEEISEDSGKNQLLTYGRFLARLSTRTHFLIVWDCDAKNMATKLRDELPQDSNVTPFAFTHRPDNQIAKNGIENNYDEDILKPYVSFRSDSEGNELGRDFRGDCKTEFADYILNHGTKQYFCHFQDLYDTVNNILNSINIPTQT